MMLFLPIAEVRAEEGKHLVDMADLLTDTQETELLQELEEISERQQFDIVVVTTTSLSGKSAME